MINKIMTFRDSLENGDAISCESNNALYKAGYNDALYHVRAFLEENKDHYSQDDDVSNTEGFSQ